MTYASEYYGGTVTIVTGAAASIVDGTIECRVGEVKNITIPCNQDISTLSLLFTVETSGKTDVATVVNGDIDKATTEATLALTSAMTSAERTLRWNLARSDTGESVASGLLFCTYDATGD